MPLHKKGQGSEDTGGAVEVGGGGVVLRVGLVFKAHRLLYHFTLGSSVMKRRRSLVLRGGTHH